MFESLEDFIEGSNNFGIHFVRTVDNNHKFLKHAVVEFHRQYWEEDEDLSRDMTEIHLKFQEMSNGGTNPANLIAALQYRKDEFDSRNIHARLYDAYQKMLPLVDPSETDGLTPRQYLTR